MAVLLLEVAGILLKFAIAIISSKCFLNSRQARLRKGIASILHYVGEMYFIRAWIYYSKLKSFGDFPIITEVLPDNQSVLTEKSVRQSRNLAAQRLLVWYQSTRFRRQVYGGMIFQETKRD